MSIAPPRAQRIQRREREGKAGGAPPAVRAFREPRTHNRAVGTHNGAGGYRRGQEAHDDADEGTAPARLVDCRDQRLGLPAHVGTERGQRPVQGVDAGGSGSRDRLAVQFKTPFFLDVLVSTSVLAEGVDLAWLV